MKFKALFLALLTVFSPAVLAMDEPQLPNTEFMQNGIASDDICLVCHKSVSDIPRDERCITTCCKKFICAEEAESILSSAQNNQWAKDAIKNKLRSSGLTLNTEQFKRMYRIAKESLNNVTSAHSSNCSQKLAVSTTFLKKPRISKHAITVIDAEEKTFTLSGELSAALLECSSLELHDDKLATPAPIDYSGITSDKKRFLKQDLIIKLAQLIKDPIKGLPHIERSLDFFELADYLTAPHNILYQIANELWPLMQDQSNDTNDIKTYKKNIRRLAQPHFASPKYLAAQNRSHCFNYKFHLINTSNRNANNQLKNNGWYQDERNQWYKVYPYCTLEGIDDLYGSTCTELNVNNQRLTTLTSDVFKNIRREHGYQITINLDNNPINCIDESFFKELAKIRSAGLYIDISLQNTRLTPAQKDDINKKFYNATTTLPQRYISQFKYNCLAIGCGCLGVALATHYLSQKSPSLINGISTLSSSILGAGVGAIGGGIVSGMSSNKGPNGYVIGIGAILGGIVGLGGAVSSEISENTNGAAYINTQEPPTSEPFTWPTYVLGIPLGGFAASHIGDHAALALAKRSHPDIKSGSWSKDEYIWKNNYKLKV